MIALISLPVSSVESFSSSAARIPEPTKTAVDDNGAATAATVDRPLLRRFGRGIRRRIENAAKGSCRLGVEGAYTSDETIPCLDMRTGTWKGAASDEVEPSSTRCDIRRAFAESSRIHASNDKVARDDETGDYDGARRRPRNRKRAAALPHGRSTGSGCSIVRVTGSDASSVLGLADYGDDFFCRVDDFDDEAEGCAASAVRDAGIIRIASHCYAGFDGDVNDEGRMQFLDTRFLPSEGGIPPMLLPFELGNLMGKASLDGAHKGMEVLLDLGTQITSAVLGMDIASSDKLVDDGSLARSSGGAKMEACDVSNSYHRLIRYLEPSKVEGSEPIPAAFGAHIDSSFLTLIPLPERPGLEVWCPSTADAFSLPSNDEGDKGGEWVQVDSPTEDERRQGETDGGEPVAYVIVMAGEFLQLTSNGDVPTCIHRVIPPRSGMGQEYVPRISAPMFLRPRRDPAAMLDVESDLGLRTMSTSGKWEPNTNIHSKKGGGLYFEEGLLDECDGMHLWTIHELNMGKN